MKNTGIWLDKNRAFIVSFENGQELTHNIPSEIEHYNIKGGSGTRFKGGPQDVVQDSKFLEREKHQFKAYFRKIAAHVKDSDALALFGPAGTNEKLKKEFEEFYVDLDQKVIAVKKADSMTKNQMKAFARNMFKEKQ